VVQFKSTINAMSQSSSGRAWSGEVLAIGGRTATDHQDGIWSLSVSLSFWRALPSFHRRGARNWHFTKVPMGSIVKKSNHAILMVTEPYDADQSLRW